MNLEPTTLSLLLGGLLVLALLLYGLRDLLRFSLYRTWAISGVVFRESVRRNVLWVTPLAMLAVVLLVQLQHPVDEADAIRQTLRACLLASALVVIVVALILASTNLPREISSRVIFTLVTKPLTRFELLLGKIIGFARLSALVLAIMGLFTLLLLWTMDFALVNRIQTTLQTELPVESRRPYLQYIADNGLLRAQRIDTGDDLQIYAELPQDPADTATAPRYFLAGPYFAAVPLELPAELIDRIRTDGLSQIVVRLRLPWKLRSGDVTFPGEPPLGVINLEDLPPAPPPFVSVQMMNVALESVIAPSAIQANQAQLPPEAGVPWPEAAVVLLDPDQTQYVADQARLGPIHIALYGLNSHYLFGVNGESVQLGVFDSSFQEIATLMPAVADGERASILLRTYLGRRGLGLTGPDEDQPAPVGVLAFRDTPTIEREPEALVDIEMRFNVELAGGILDERDDTLMQASVHNLTTGFTSDATVLFPETGRSFVLRVPYRAIEGGDFDLRLQTLSRGHTVSVSGAGVKLVVDRQPFAWNLAKMLLVLWLMSLLVITAGLTFSTFVSWPVAATMTVFGLTGRWVAQQIGETSESMGRMAAEEMLGSEGDVGAKEAVRVGVDALTDFFSIVTAFLPDMSAYGTAELVEQGLLIDWSHVGAAGWVTLAFALPMLAVAYIVLRNKEVAP